jgi:hypothetical protein
VGADEFVDETVVVTLAGVADEVVMVRRSAMKIRATGGGLDAEINHRVVA